MKSLLLLPFVVALSTPTMAQQVNDFCEQVQHREVYVPGGYDRYGNYVPGRVRTESYKNSCQGYAPNNYPLYQKPMRQEACRPTNTILGALLGGGIAASVSKKDAYGWSIPLGAVGGGLLLGCND